MPVAAFLLEDLGRGLCVLSGSVSSFVKKRPSTEDRGLRAKGRQQLGRTTDASSSAHPWAWPSLWNETVRIHEREEFSRQRQCDPSVTQPLRREAWP